MPLFPSHEGTKPLDTMSASRAAVPPAAHQATHDTEHRHRAASYLTRERSHLWPWHLTVTDMPARVMFAPHANAGHCEQMHEHTHVFILEVPQMAAVGHHTAATLPQPWH